MNDAIEAELLGEINRGDRQVILLGIFAAILLAIVVIQSGAIR